MTLTPYTGPCTITVNNTVIDAKTINCNITIQATGVVIKRSHVNGHVQGPDQQTTPYSFRVEDSFVDGSPNGPVADRAIGFANFTVVRSEIVGGQGGIWCVRNCTIQDTWVHGTDLDPNSTWHASAMREEQYGTIFHNSISCDWTLITNNEIGCSADLTGYPDFAPIHHNTVDRNLFVANPTGNAYCAYGGGTGGKPFSGDPTNATYQVFTNNTFQRGTGDRNGINQCGDFGPIDSFIVGRTGNVWSGNVWDSGGTVPPA